MFDIVRNINRLRRDIAVCREGIVRQRQELDHREQSCIELERLLEPLAQIAAAGGSKNPIPEAVREKMRVSQRARWEKRKSEQQVTERGDHFSVEEEAA